MIKFAEFLKKIKLYPAVKTRLKGLLTVSILILAAILFFASSYNFKKPVQTTAILSIPDEIINIKNTTDLPTQVQWYKQLIDRVGPIAAQENLVNSGLPFTGQTHLLNHAVGDWLYQHDGASGLIQCKEYFLASCYHGFVLDAIASGGIPEVTKVMQVCKQEGINTVYTQCAHAVGHGFLADIGYKNLTQALTMCDQMISTVPDFPMFNCYDGIFMENIWALHEGGISSPDRWVKMADPFYPCDDNRIDQKYLLGCWSNQPALMYQLFAGNLQEVADQCAQVKPSNFMEMCYNGLSRQIHPIAAGDLDRTFNLCGLLGNKWSDYCVVIIDQASFAVGDRSLPFAICDRIKQESKDQCYQGLVGMIGVYAESATDRNDLCKKINNDTWKNRCVIRQQ